MTIRLFLCLLLGMVTTTLGSAQVLRVAWDSFEPYQFQKGTQITGLDVDLLQAIAARGGWRLEFTQMPWARQLASLKSGAIDVMFDASVTEERQAFGEFSLPYRVEAVHLMGLNKPTTRPKTLREALDDGGIVGIQRGSEYGGPWLELMGEAQYRDRVEEVTDVLTNVKKLANGRITYLVDDPAVARYEAQNLGLPRPQTVVEIDSSPVSLLFSRRFTAAHPGFMARVNGAIRDLTAQGTFRKLFVQWGLESE